MKIAIIVPRYGADVLGGAESQARGFAEEAARRGWTVEVWTTCAKSHYTWENVYPAGEERNHGVLVRRFPITHLDLERKAELDIRIASQGVLSVADQYDWLKTGAHSAPLYAHVARYAGEFDAAVALPYAMPLTHYAAWAAPQDVIVWPCLHDEPYAYTEPVRLLLESVQGVMFLSPEEKQLAIQHLNIAPAHGGTLGGGVSLSSIRASSTQATNSTFSHVLYMGRLETGKGLTALYEYVQRRFKENKAIRLTVLGKGPCLPPDHPAFDYRGFVTEGEKAIVCASALALCQPSLNESFSRTIMESWLAGRPVLVHGECAVTRGHVQRSKGGLWFQTYEEFVGAVEWLRNNPSRAAQMGQNGKQYVLSNYTWQAVGDRFEGFIRQWGKNDE